MLDQWLMNRMKYNETVENHHPIEVEHKNNRKITYRKTKSLYLINLEWNLYVKK